MLCNLVLPVLHNMRVFSIYFKLPRLTLPYYFDYLVYATFDVFRNVARVIRLSCQFSSVFDFLLPFIMIFTYIE